MGLDDLVSLVAAALVVAAFIRGVAAYREINRIYHEDPGSPILKTIRDGSLVKVRAAGWFGAITAAAVLGFGPYPILRPISIILAVQVLDLPSRYLYMIQTIRGEPVGALGLPISVILRNLRSRL